MPESDRFQIGEFFLTQHRNSPVWKVGWYDRATGQTRRASLGTKDVSEAKKALAEFVVKQAQPRDQRPADMPLALILVRYWDGHAAHIASSEAARCALTLWTEYWQDTVVADVTVPRQKEFLLWLKCKGYRNAYVSRTMSVGRAALNMAWKHGEITSVPFIIDEPDRSDAKQAYKLDKSEMRALLTTVQLEEQWQHLYAFVMIALNTLARPDAILDLAPAQVRLSDRHIVLNPAGRKQTKKRRPIVPITDTLMPFVQRRDVARFVNWHGDPIGSVKKGFRTVVSEAKLPADITPYSLRHTMAVELRKQGVPQWEVSGLLGHRAPGVTEVYAEFAPDYLSKGREAIDAYFVGLNLPLPVPHGLSVSQACQMEKLTTRQTADLLTN